MKSRLKELNIDCGSFSIEIQRLECIYRKKNEQRCNSVKLKPFEIESKKNSIQLQILEFKSKKKEHINLKEEFTKEKKSIQMQKYSFFAKDGNKI
ncbi:MAG: hypothetical protein LBS15_01825 [Endomicrobium sp.]|jgi:hypothetical protein|nr:hypothetical protein [Endomicrobium sp.]